MADNAKENLIYGNAVKSIGFNGFKGFELYTGRNYDGL